MSTTQVTSPSVPFGRPLGAAVRSGRDLLDIVLIAEATTYDTWIVLNLIATGAGDGVLLDDLQRDLRQALPGPNEATVAELLAQMTRLGLVRTVHPVSGNASARAALTAEGGAEFQRMLAVVNAVPARALSGIDPEDVATTIRVLSQFQKEAAASWRRCASGSGEQVNGLLQRPGAGLERFVCPGYPLEVEAQESCLRFGHGRADVGRTGAVRADHGTIQVGRICSQPGVSFVQRGEHRALLGANAEQIPLPRLPYGNEAIGPLAGLTQQRQEPKR